MRAERARAGFISLHQKNERGRGLLLQQSGSFDSALARPQRINIARCKGLLRMDAYGFEARRGMLRTGLASFASCRPNSECVPARSRFDVSLSDFGVLPGLSGSYGLAEGTAAWK
jgi:hypothetical protein